MVIEKKHRLNRESYKGLVRGSFILCSRDKRPLFMQTELRRLILDGWRYMTTRYACSVTVYVFMPDHIHLLLKGESTDADLYQFVTQTKRTVSYHIGKVIWQKGFFDHLLRDRLDLARQIMYVLMNPVRAGLASDWWRYDGSGSLTGSLDEIMQFARDMKQLAEREGKQW